MIKVGTKKFDVCYHLDSAIIYFDQEAFGCTDIIWIEVYKRTFPRLVSILA